jgi:hypothetical protein
MGILLVYDVTDERSFNSELILGNPYWSGEGLTQIRHTDVVFER